jgi:hypothetical protein
MESSLPLIDQHVRVLCSTIIFKIAGRTFTLKTDDVPEKDE